ncbi:MAG: aldehyde dehydrogenase family protein [Actinobacteria bacterium]|nr:aldehyde dehydrogenase family protein [Actinomycetota bacterium]
MTTTEEITYTSGSLSEELDRQFEAELGRLREAGPAPARHMIGGEWSEEGAVIERLDPAHTDTVASSAHEGGADAVARAVEAAQAAAPAWRALGAARRAELIHPLADALRFSQIELAALLALETGKSRMESVGEVLEAVEMVEVFCAEASRAEDWTRPLQSADGVERNASVLRPYGVFGVITPFNFPVALFTGMSLGALLGGNTVVAKPSEDAPASGAKLVELFASLDLAPGVFNAVHGGEETGRALVEGQVDGIAFTGSAEVGRTISRRFQEGPYARPVVTEMGGKNPAIVGASADLAEAAEGVARAAFGMSGQKCSATSRAIVAAEVYDEFLALLKRRASELPVGEPLDREAWVGPMVNAAALDRYRAAVAEAEADGSVEFGGGTPDLPGNYAEPTVVAGLPRGHRLTREELFAPLVTVTPVDSIEEALEEANAVPYGLTAGIYSKDPAEIDRFLDEIEAGVVFVNRRAGATTGSWPGQQSFCGWKSSGSTGKGGLGPWYLQQFMREQSRTVVAP